MTHIIELYLDGNGWMTKNNDPKFMELFGTDTLPTPFLKETKVALIVQTLETLNPNAVIKVRS